MEGKSRSGSKGEKIEKFVVVVFFGMVTFLLIFYIVFLCD